MRRRFGLAMVTVLLLAAMALSNEALAQNNKNEATVLAVGTGRFSGEDFAAGRDEALNNSLVMAVSRVLGELMPQEILSGQFKALNEAVLSHTDQFVMDYKVLAEFKATSTYRLLVQATISTVRLKGALQKAGVRLGQIPYPRVLLCIAEKQIQDETLGYWWKGQSAEEGVFSAALAKFLAEKGYPLVHAGPLSMGNYPPELSPAEAAAIGQQLQADVVITGVAMAEEAANTKGASVRSFRGTINATAIRVSDGQAIARTQRSAMTAGNDPVAGGREALASAAVMAGEELNTQIGEIWFKQSAASTPLEILVQGLGGNIANFVKFRGALSSTSGVTNLQLKEMMSGAAVLTVDYQGTAESLADALLLLEFDTFGINIESVDGSKISLKLVAKQK